MLYGIQVEFFRENYNQQASTVIELILLFFVLIDLILLEVYYLKFVNF